MAEDDVGRVYIVLVTINIGGPATTYVHSAHRSIKSARKALKAARALSVGGLSSTAELHEADLCD